MSAHSAPTQPRVVAETAAEDHCGCSTGTATGLRTDSTVAMADVIVAPGSGRAWHIHPAPASVMSLEGDFAFLTGPDGHVRVVRVPPGASGSPAVPMIETALRTKPPEWPVLAPHNGRGGRVGRCRHEPDTRLLPLQCVEHGQQVRRYRAYLRPGEAQFSYFYDVRGVRGVAVPPDPGVNAVRHADVVVAAPEDPADTGEQGERSVAGERLEEDIDVENLGQLLPVDYRRGIEAKRWRTVARFLHGGDGDGQLIHLAHLSLRRAEQALPQQVGLAAPVHTPLGQLELVDKALRLPVAVGQCQASVHGLIVVAQAQRETAHLGTLSPCRRLDPVVQPFALAFAYHAQEVLRQGIDGGDGRISLAEVLQVGDLLRCAPLRALHHEGGHPSRRGTTDTGEGRRSPRERARWRPLAAQLGAETLDVGDGVGEALRSDLCP